MKLYYSSGTSGPGIHALVIGVGAYPYASADLLDQIPTSGGHILTSAMKSARHFAERLLDTKPGPWIVPVSSIDLLVSPQVKVDSPDGRELIPTEPSIDAIRAAFDQWLERCSSDADNVAVFYFCGHGVQSAEQVLLASDFGARPNDPFQGAFAFDTTRENMMQRLPATQCFLIDACRMPSSMAVRSSPRDVGPLLVNQSPFQPRHCRFDLTLRAPIIEEWEGRRGQVSYFTAALVEALEGQAATVDEHGDWVVSTDTVGSRIGILLQNRMGGDTAESVARGEFLENRVLRRMDSTPHTSIAVWCDPRIALAAATLGCVSIPEPAQVVRQRGREPGFLWRVDVPAGHYSVSAQFDGDVYPGVSRIVFAEPPLVPVALRVTP